MVYSHELSCEVAIQMQKIFYQFLFLSSTFIWPFLKGKGCNLLTAFVEVWSTKHNYSAHKEERSSILQYMRIEAIWPLVVISDEQKLLMYSQGLLSHIPKMIIDLKVVIENKEKLVLSTLLLCK